MLRKYSGTFMLSKAQREYFNHPSTHPAKNAGFAQDRFLCAASKHIIAQNSYLRNISYSFIWLDSMDGKFFYLKERGTKGARFCAMFYTNNYVKRNTKVNTLFLSSSLIFSSHCRQT